MKALIVDDSEITRVMLGEMLAAFGHTVAAEADTMDGALSAYDKHKPDFVTLDLSMPTIDGLSVLNALRRLDPKAKVLVVSANSQERINSALLAAGAAGFLSKPIVLDELEAALTRLERK